MPEKYEGSPAKDLATNSDSESERKYSTKYDKQFTEQDTSFSHDFALFWCLIVSLSRFGL